MTSAEVPVRVRFAPSPTGMFHVGGARSALYNWATARQRKGTFVLRIEDTDAARNKPEWTDGIISALAAIGITADDPVFECPHFQSANSARHRDAVAQLRAEGRAYLCDCAREQIAERTGSEHLGYDGFCRDRALADAPGRATRFRTPDADQTVVVDLVRGTPSFPNASIEDFVIARGDGTPVFLLANVVDDIDQGITEVIRGEEHLSNTPKQRLLWEALGAEPPVWAHLPVIVNEKRQKLSKRRDKVALEDYLTDGYLPAAMMNYLMLLGWGPKDGGELQPYPELERQFRIEDVNTSSAFFDVRKLAAFNGEYIRALSAADFAEACQPWLRAPHAPWDAGRFDEALFAQVAPLVQTRITVLSEVVGYIDFLFLREPVWEEASWSKAMKPGAEDVLREARNTLAVVPWRAADIQTALEQVAAVRGLKMGKAQAPLRVAVTGRTVGLPLFESLETLGRDQTLARLEAALAKLSCMPVPS